MEASNGTKQINTTYSKNPKNLHDFKFWKKIMENTNKKYNYTIQKLELIIEAYDKNKPRSLNDKLHFIELITNSYLNLNEKDKKVLALKITQKQSNKHNSTFLEISTIINSLIAITQTTTFAKKTTDQKIKVFYDSTFYIGNLKNEQPHGQGKSNYPNGHVYEGEFKYGHCTGQGKYTFQNGDVYEGEFLKGMFHGKGKLSYLKENLYEVFSCTFKEGKPFINANEAQKQLSSTKFASLLAGTNHRGSMPPYSIQILSKYLLKMDDKNLNSAGRELEFASKLHFLEPKKAEIAVLNQIRSKGQALIPFGFKKHSMLLGLNKTNKGIEARIYNSGGGLEFHNRHNINGKIRFETCKSVLFEGMTLDSKEFTKLLPKILQAGSESKNANETYGLFETAVKLDNGSYYQSPQKSGNCEYKSVMVALLHILGREAYTNFKLDLVTNILKEHTLNDREDYSEGSTIRADTINRLKKMQEHLLTKAKSLTRVNASMKEI